MEKIKTYALSLLLMVMFSNCSVETIESCTPKEGLWENKTIPYYLDSRWEGTEDLEVVYSAFAVYEALGFTFIEIPQDKLFNHEYEAYIYIKYSSFAQSHIGRKGGEQQMYLPVGWNTFYDTTLHEIGHAVGLQHTHKRADRDEYLTIHWDNILEGEEAFFEVSPDYHTGLDYYDIYSIMSYECHSKTKNGLPTMTLKDGSCFEPADGLSEGDKQVIQYLYCGL